MSPGNSIIPSDKQFDAYANRFKRTCPECDSTYYSAEDELCPDCLHRQAVSEATELWVLTPELTVLFATKATFSHYVKGFTDRWMIKCENTTFSVEFPTIHLSQRDAIKEQIKQLKHKLDYATYKLATL